MAKLAAAKDQLALASKELQGRRPNERLLAELAGAQAELKERSEAMAALEQGGVGSSAGFASYLRAFARHTSDGLWLTGFTIGEGGRDMEIRGRMLQPALLPDYIRRLNSEAAFRGRSFAALDMRRGEADKGRPQAGTPRPLEFVLTSNAAASADAQPLAASAREQKP